MTHHSYQIRQVHLLRVETGDDLLEAIEEFVATQGIETAWVSYLGAVKRAALRYYDQTRREYGDLEINEPLEVLSGTGNVSLLDGRPFVHTHAVFADEEGRAFGGHLNYGCEVWALEVKIEEYEGEAPVRLPHDETGLNLWAQAPPAPS